MRAKIVRLHSPDVELEKYSPSSLEDFSVLVQVMVAPAGVEGEESFDINICTPRNLERAVRSGPVLGRHLLIVGSWNYMEIQQYIVKLVESLEAESWPELGEKIGRIGKWEFEDYVPYVDSDH